MLALGCKQQKLTLGDLSEKRIFCKAMGQFTRLKGRPRLEQTGMRKLQKVLLSIECWPHSWNDEFQQFL